METCPCGSGLAYSACCEPLINGERPAETAESLLRSRYSAYNAKAVEYIIETTHPEQKQPDTRTTIESWAENTLWHKLEILECVDGGPNDDAGTVEFIAEYTEKGKRQKHHELAEFHRKDGKWYFFDAHVPKVKQVIRSAPKTGRNDPCPCGSGKKYKKCCAA